MQKSYGWITAALCVVAVPVLIAVKASELVGMGVVGVLAAVTVAAVLFGKDTPQYPSSKKRQKAKEERVPVAPQLVKVPPAPDSSGSDDKPSGGMGAPVPSPKTPPALFGSAREPVPAERR